MHLLPLLNISENEYPKKSQEFSPLTISSVSIFTVLCVMLCCAIILNLLFLFYSVQIDQCKGETYPFPSA